MKVLKIVSASALCLLTSAGTAFAQDAQPNQMNQQAAQQSAMPGGDQMRDTSMGGVPGQKTQTGTRILYGAPCTGGSFCDIYHGN
ncbi:hypothetical protein [Paraburkholderia ginsengiterrae]|uniref:hypothetical protein n=1 Tax=Paraburkholderia ginsengiterrae TaxID=1462993 RepID=UPI000B100497|nr:hypothetical protein [Paraburkholderia ginsengiterrae]